MKRHFWWLKSEVKIRVQIDNSNVARGYCGDDALAALGLMPHDRRFPDSLTDASPPRVSRQGRQMPIGRAIGFPFDNKKPDKALIYLYF